MLYSLYTTMTGILQEQQSKSIDNSNYMTSSEEFMTPDDMTQYSAPTSYGVPYNDPNNVAQQRSARNVKQRCTRCKRWKEKHQFENEDPLLPEHAGCLECRESARKYGQSEYGRATRRNYNQSDKAKETRKKYAQSEKGKQSRKRYAQTEKAKEVRRKYNQSEKAKETRKKRALLKAGREQANAKMMDTGQFDLVPSLVDSMAFDPSQGQSEQTRSMEKVFWQTVSKTIYDRSKAQYDKYLGDHEEFEVDIRFKYRRTK